MSRHKKKTKVAMFVETIFKKITKIATTQILTIISTQSRLGNKTNVATVLEDNRTNLNRRLAQIKY